MVHVEYSATIDASPEKIYAVISDYHVGHQAIVPKPYFSNFVIEQGGRGAGTILTFDFTVMGQTSHYRDEVSEPEPGRILREVDEALGVDTSFILDAFDSGKRTRVTIRTDFRDKPGFQGFMERLINPMVAKRLYKQELQNLAEYVAANP